MINLQQRSYEKELMDSDNISPGVMAMTLKELNIINSRLGGHSITIKGVKKLMINTKPLTICEIGCGGGDNLFAIYNYCKKHNSPVSFVGIDLNPDCITFAKQKYPQMPCEWICNDFRIVNFGENKPDIIFSSLFCHHFTNEQLIIMLQWLRQNSRLGFFINDLHRHWLAWYLIKYITRIFSRSYLVKNDACLSVARSFRKEEWRQLFSSSGIPYYTIDWQWSFRWLIIAHNKKK